MISSIVGATEPDEAHSPYEAEIQRAVRRVAIDRLMSLAAAASMPQVRAITTAYLERARNVFERHSAPMATLESPVTAHLAHERLLAMDIGRFLDRPGEPYGLQSAPDAPPEAPIGSPAMDFLSGAGSGGWDLSRGARDWRSSGPSGLPFAPSWLEQAAPYCSHGEW